MIGADPDTTGRRGADDSTRQFPRRRTDLLEVEIDAETVVYDPIADIVHHFDPPGTRIWQQIDHHRDVRSLAGRIATEFGVQGQAVAADVAGFVTRVTAAGLLGQTPATAGQSPPTGTATVASPAGPEIDPTPVRSGRMLTTAPKAALRHPFRVRTNIPGVRDFLARVTASLPDTSDDPAEYDVFDVGALPGGGPYVVRHDATIVTTTPWSDRALAVLLWRINAEAIRWTSQVAPVVHAAAATHAGTAIVLPGSAGSGKSTTIAGLVRAGLGYLTDEAVALDPSTLHAMSYPRSVSIDRGSWSVLADLRPPDADRIAGQWQVPPDVIRHSSVVGPAPVRHIVAPSYRRGATTALEPVTRGQMLVDLLDSTFRFAEHPRRNLTVVADVVADAACWRLTIGALDEAVSCLVDLVTDTVVTPA